MANEFDTNEKVLCFDQNYFYAGRCVDTRVKEGEREYFIYYTERITYEWVPESRLKKFNDENMMSLNALLSPNLKLNLEKQTKRKKEYYMTCDAKVPVNFDQINIDDDYDYSVSDEYTAEQSIDAIIENVEENKQVIINAPKNKVVRFQPDSDETEKSDTAFSGDYSLSASTPLTSGLMENQNVEAHDNANDTENKPKHDSNESIDYSVSDEHTAAKTIVNVEENKQVIINTPKYRVVRFQPDSDETEKNDTAFSGNYSLSASTSLTSVVDDKTSDTGDSIDDKNQLNYKSLYTNLMSELTRNREQFVNFSNLLTGLMENKNAEAHDNANDTENKPKHDSNESKKVNYEIICKSEQRSLDGCDYRSLYISQLEYTNKCIRELITAKSRINEHLMINNNCCVEKAMRSKRKNCFYKIIMVFIPLIIICFYALYTFFD